MRIKIRERVRARSKAALALGIAALCAIGAPAVAAPEGSGSGSLEDYLLRAQAHNPQLRAFKERYEAAMERIPQASALPDPMLQVTRFVESVQTRTGPQEHVILLNQRIPWFGKLDGREALASAEAEALWYAWQNQQLSLARSVAEAYYEYGFTERAIRLSSENLKLLRELEPVVQSKVEGGGELNALLRLKVEIGKVEDRMLSLEQKRTIQSARLQELLAIPDDALLPWPDWEAPQPVEPAETNLLAAIEAHNPSLKMLERRIASAEARRQLARLESFPDLTLGVNYIDLGNPEVNPTTPDAGKDPWGVTLAVNIPLWQGKNRAARSEALASQRAAESTYADHLNSLRAELRSGLASLADANRRLTLYGEELLGLAEQAVEISRSSYESGRTGILEVIDSERSLLELQLAYWRAAADAWQQRILIQTLANQPVNGNFQPTGTHE